MAVEDATGWIRNWGMFLDGELHSKTPVVEAIHVANRKAGFRCCATEILITAYCDHLSEHQKNIAARHIAQCAQAIRDPLNAWKYAELADAIRGGLGTLIRFFFAAGTFDIYSAQYETPSICLIPREQQSTVIRTPENASKIIGECKSKGQTNALATLAQIARVRHEFKEVAGIPIRQSAMLVGMSGSGKTWVAKQFARASGWPMFSTTVSSWIPMGAKAEPYTLAQIRSALVTPLVIFVDECDKIQTRSSDNNQNWYRGCMTELMLTIDRTPDISLTASERANLDRSWIICAGAFQEIFRAKCGEIQFAEELENLEITRADLEEKSGLPTEFLNRAGLVIHVAPPTAKELANAYKTIEGAVGFAGNEKARVSAANQAAIELKGFRGLEEYALQCARSVIAKRPRGDQSSRDRA